MLHLSRRQFLRFCALAGGGMALAACQLITRPPEATQEYAEFDKEAGIVSQAHKIPGLAIGIVQDGKLVHEAGFGTRNLDTGEPMTSKSIMSMASISKAFTSTAIMQLIEAGKLQVDDPFVKHVPYFEMEDPRYTDITIRHLLGHNSGLPELTDDIFFSEFMDPWYDDDCAERYVRSLKTGVTLNQDPGGDQFLYSDFGYDILADLIHKLTGELFEDYMKHHIFEPLGMKDSTFLFEEVPPEALVAAHVYDKEGNAAVWEYFPYDRKHAPSSCLHSNLEDISRWVLAHSNGGELDGQRILQPESQAQLWEPLFHWGDEDILTDYGWGWQLGTFEGKRIVTSLGGQPGVQTSVAILPEEGLSVMAFGNLLGALGEINDPYYIFEFVTWALGELSAA